MILAHALLCAGLASAATPPRGCASGNPPRLSGDAFSPVECSSATKPVPGLPAFAPPPEALAPKLKDFAGSWRGVVIAGMGRYDAALTVKTRWGGKADIALRLKELQFRETQLNSLTLAPRKGGGYDAALSVDLVPGLVLKGTAAFVPGGLELSFANGASHRLLLTRDGERLVVKADSSVPGAPLQSFETTLARER